MGVIIRKRNCVFEDLDIDNWNVISNMNQYFEVFLLTFIHTKGYFKIYVNFKVVVLKLQCAKKSPGILLKCRF